MYLCHQNNDPWWSEDSGEYPLSIHTNKYHERTITAYRDLDFNKDVKERLYLPSMRQQVVEDELAVLGLMGIEGHIYSSTLNEAIMGAGSYPNQNFFGVDPRYKGDREYHPRIVWDKPKPVNEPVLTKQTNHTPLKLTIVPKVVVDDEIAIQAKYDAEFAAREKRNEEYARQRAVERQRYIDEENRRNTPYEYKYEEDPTVGMLPHQKVKYYAWLREIGKIADYRPFDKGIYERQSAVDKTAQKKMNAHKKMMKKLGL